MAYRNPNGYGSVVKLNGKRRKPYAVRKTVDFDDRAYPIYAVLGYYSTRKEAMLALANYNAKPYDINLAKCSFNDLYKMWSEQEFPAMKPSSVASHKAAYKHCKPLYRKQYSEIRKADMQACISGCGKAYSTQINIRNLFSKMDKFAFDNDIIDKCYSQNLTVCDKEVKAKKTPFTDAEVQTLWKHQCEETIDETLFMLYTGCRVTEMLTLTCDKINLDEGIIQHGIKTAAGKNRIIPIHSDLLPIIQRHMNDGFLFSDWSKYETSKSKYDWFSRIWEKKLATLGMYHTTHECRHTFRSKLDSAEANRVCIDLIMGHKSASIGERVYTHKTIEELKVAISKLSYSV